MEQEETEDVDDNNDDEKGRKRRGGKVENVPKEERCITDKGL